jgi:lipoprotein-anchoring transpeptidase ErfK/SrfK
MSGRSQAKKKVPTGAKHIRVFLTDQVLHAFQGATRVYAFDCVTGSSDHPTRPGKFRVTRKDRIHHSAKYNAQMNYAMFFSADGKAIHQYHGVLPLAAVRLAKSGLSDWFGSHGCVRLTENDAKTLFDWTPIGTPVHIR